MTAYLTARPHLGPRALHRLEGLRDAVMRPASPGTTISLNVAYSLIFANGLPGDCESQLAGRLGVGSHQFALQLVALLARHVCDVEWIAAGGLFVLLLLVRLRTAPLAQAQTSQE